MNYTDTNNTVNKLLVDYGKLKDNCEKLIEMNIQINDLLVIHTDAESGDDIVSVLSRILNEYTSLKEENLELKSQIKDLEYKFRKVDHNE